MIKKLLTFCLLFLPVLLIGKPIETTLHDFMEKYSKTAMKNSKNGNDQYLLEIYKSLPSMAIKEDQSKWKEIVNKAVETKNFKESCSSCHKLYKKEYQNKYKSRPIQISEDLIKLLDKMK